MCFWQHLEGGQDWEGLNCNEIITNPWLVPGGGGVSGTGMVVHSCPSLWKEDQAFGPLHQPVLNGCEFPLERECSLREGRSL